jgi:hypothetical protein
MTDKTEKTGKTGEPRKPKELPLQRRASYEQVLENIEKWANSRGLQRPN